MLAQIGTGLGLLTVAFAATLQLAAPGSGLLAVFAGLWLVAGGTIMLARISFSQPVFKALSQAVALVTPRRTTPASEEDELHWFLQAASLFRYGNVRRAEAATQRIADPILKRGTQLVLDGFAREQVTIALQRQIAENRDYFRRPMELLHAMGGYAPTLGMLGTLLGLVQMLFGLSAGNMDTVGASMGFAMLTTVYGLVLANLIFKPLASKLEQTGRRLTAASAAQMQAVMMLYDREHSVTIRELMGAVQPQSPQMADAKPLHPVSSY